MKKYRIVLLGELPENVGRKNSIYISGWLTVYKHHYIIIDEFDGKNYFPKSKCIILTINE
jgi:hypothetical protein